MRAPFRSVGRWPLWFGTRRIVLSCATISTSVALTSARRPKCMPSSQPAVVETRRVVVATSDAAPQIASCWQRFLAHAYSFWIFVRRFFTIGMPTCFLTACGTILLGRREFVNPLSSLNKILLSAEAAFLVVFSIAEIIEDSSEENGTLNGQTPGMKQAGTQLVRTDGDPVTVFTLLLDMIGRYFLVVDHL